MPTNKRFRPPTQSPAGPPPPPTPGAQEPLPAAPGFDISEVLPILIQVFRELRADQRDERNAGRLVVLVEGPELVERMRETAEAIRDSLSNGSFDERLESVAERFRPAERERLSRFAELGLFLASHIDTERNYELPLGYFMYELGPLCGLSDPMAFESRLPDASDG